ncbi:MAG: peptidylprolyl isomerase [Caulobacter sp.]|nr:peptidylprolyl isomerase [Caulobacter sp.]
MKTILAPLAALSLLAAHAAPALSAPAPTAADWRTPDPENVLVIETNKGTVFVELSPLAAPAHAERLKTLTRAKFYDGLTFFRVIDNFMDQTGDPNNQGTGGSTLPNLEPEFGFRRGASDPYAFVTKMAPTNDQPSATEVGFVGSLPVRSAPQMQMMMTADGKVGAWPLFCGGVAGMARGEAPNSANSQFFLMRALYPSLNRNYTAFGRVIAGQDAVRKIKVGEPPADPMDRMLTVRVLADIPEAQRPKVQVMDARSPAFQALVAETQKAKGPSFSICDVEIPSKVG